MERLRAAAPLVSQISQSGGNMLLEQGSGVLRVCLVLLESLGDFGFFQHARSVSSFPGMGL